MHENPYQDCIDGCNECFLACETCATACLHEADLQKMVRCIEMDRTCADICALASRLMARQDTFAPALCRLCAEICRACGQECAKHEHMEHCRKCAEACFRCAEACEKWPNQ